jgi:hypothetical protein
MGIAMKPIILAFFTGLLFAIGLGISGMTDANKVIGFLDVTGRWDPSLAFVMVGAIGVHAIAYKRQQTMSAPLLTERFRVPQRNDMDTRLVGGAGLFGAGWALSGYCPGPAIVSLASGSAQAIVFVLMLLVGMAMHDSIEQFIRRRARDQDPSIKPA